MFFEHAFRGVFFCGFLYLRRCTLNALLLATLKLSGRLFCTAPPCPMPYLRPTCPELLVEQKRWVAAELTRDINDLFFNPRGGPSREELLERTTVHFTPYSDADLFIGGRTQEEWGTPDVTVELSDWSMNIKQPRKLAAALTPRLGELLGVSAGGLDAVNIRFHSYPPSDFAVGGKLLSDRVPWMGRFMKRVAG